MRGRLSATMIALIACLAAAMPAAAQRLTCPDMPRTYNDEKRQRASLGLKLQQALGLIEVSGEQQQARRALSGLQTDVAIMRLSMFVTQCRSIAAQFANDPARARAELEAVFWRLMGARPPQAAPAPASVPKPAARPAPPVTPPPAAARPNPSRVITAAPSAPAPITAPPAGRRAPAPVQMIAPSEQWALLYKRPIRAGTYNVIVGSFPYGEKDRAFAEVDALRQRFPNVDFALHDTVARDAESNAMLAIFIGHGLNRDIAQNVAGWARQVGIAPDAYIAPQHWDTAPSIATPDGPR